MNDAYTACEVFYKNGKEDMRSEILAKLRAVERYTSGIIRGTVSEIIAMVEEMK